MSGKDENWDFLNNLPKDCTTKEIIKQISNLDVNRNDAQKRYIENLDAHSAVLKLVTIGHREEAKQIAQHCFKNSKANYNLKIAREMAEFLMNHEFKFGSLLEAQKWERHYTELDSAISAQVRAKRMYGTVLNNHMMGLTLPKVDILAMVQNLEENIKYDSTWYLYYYYQIKSLLYEGKDLENMLLEVIAVYERKYIKHTNFIVIFKNELINYYKDNKDYARALKVVEEALSITNEDTIPFFNITYKQTELYTDIGDYVSAISSHKRIKESPIYESIAEDHKQRWELLYDRIIEEKANNE